MKPAAVPGGQGKRRATPGEKWRTGAPAAPRPSPLSPVMLAAVLWAALAILLYPTTHRTDLLAHDVLAVTLAPLLDVTLAGVLAAVRDAVPAALVLAATLLACAGLGRHAAAVVRLPWRGAGERLLFTMLPGLLGFGLTAWALGALGFYSASMYAGLIAFGAAQAFPVLRRTRALTARPPDAPPWAWWAKAGLGAVVLVQAGALLSGFTPPHVSDESIYHLGFAQWHLFHGRAVAWRSNYFEFNPQLATMLYGAPVSFGLLWGVKWIHQAAGWLAALGLAELLAGGPPAIRRAALLLFLSIPSIWGFSGRAFNDVLILGFATGALVAARRAANRPGKSGTGYAVLAGVLVGGAGSMKYTGLLAGALLFAGLSPRRLALAGGAAAVVLLPWLWKSFILIGNPLFPYFWKVFGGLGWDAHLDWRLQKAQLQGEFSAKQRLLELPWSLWKMLVYGGYSGPDGSTGHLLAFALPLALAGATWRELVAVSAFSLPILFSAPGIRILFPAIPLGLAVAARQLAKADPPRVLRGAGLAVFTALLWWQAFEYFPAFWRPYDNPLPVVLRQQPLGRWLDRWLYPSIYHPPSYSRMLAAVHERIPAGERVLFLGGYGGAFYLDRPTFFNPLEWRPLPIPLAREAQDFHRLNVKFKQLDIRWVIVNHQQNDIFFDFWKMWDWHPGFEATRWVNYWDHYARPVWKYGNQLEIFRLQRQPNLEGHQLTPGLEEETTRLLVYIIRKGDAATADSVIKGIKPLFPRNAQLWLRDAETNIRKGDYKQAKRCCDTVQYLAPGSMDLLRCRAAVAAANGEFATAAQLLRIVVQREAWDAQGWLDLSQVLERLGDVPGAKWAKFESELRKEFRWERW